MQDRYQIKVIALQEATKMAPLIFPPQVIVPSPKDILAVADQFEDMLSGRAEQKASNHSKILLAAQTAHEVNRELQIFLEEKVISPVWSNATEETQRSAVDGVKAIFNKPSITAEELHNNWMKFRTEHGWTYAAEHDVERKVHPCMVPYHDLSVEQRFKDALFHTVVRTILFG